MRGPDWLTFCFPLALLIAIARCVLPHNYARRTTTSLFSRTKPPPVCGSGQATAFKVNEFAAILLEDSNDSRDQFVWSDGEDILDIIFRLIGIYSSIVEHALVKIGCGILSEHVDFVGDEFHKCKKIREISFR